MKFSLKHILLTLSLLSLSIVAEAVEYRRLAASIVYERWEWGGSDWCLSFRIPSGFRLAWVERTTDRSNNLWGHILSGGGYVPGSVWVDITAGYRARLYSRAGYRSINAWKDEIYVWVYR